MRTIHYTIQQQDDGRQVGSILRMLGVSARLCIRLKNTPGGIAFNGRHIRTVDPVTAGGVLTLLLPDDERPAAPSSVSVPVVYEDDDLIVLDKPPYLPVHPVHEYRDNTLAGAFAAHLAARGVFQAFRPIGRLDRCTSGLVLSALHQLAASKLRDSCAKTYYCICEGELSGSGTIRAPLRRKEGHGIQREAGEDGEPAVTHYRVLSCKNGHTSLRIVLETGRTHQIRAHFACIGHPLTGDSMYGEAHPLIGRQALHCDSMRIIHPISGEVLTLFSPVSPDIAKLAQQYDLALPPMDIAPLTSVADVVDKENCT